MREGREMGAALLERRLVENPKLRREKSSSEVIADREFEDLVSGSRISIPLKERSKGALARSTGL
jgi:hypothetical protein